MWSGGIREGGKAWLIYRVEVPLTGVVALVRAMSGERLEATGGSKEDPSPAFWPSANEIYKRKHNHSLR